MFKNLFKSWLAILLLFVGVGASWGTDVTFNPSSDQTFPKDGITISVTSGTLTNGTDYRVYKNATMTIVSTVGNITNIVLTYSNASYDGGGWAASYQPNSTSWTSPTASGEQARITKLVVTVSSGGGTNYTVIVAEGIENGTVTATPTTAAAGATVSLTATPADGYEFAAWDVKDASSNAVTVTDNKFSMPASNVTVSATFNKTQGGGDSGNETTYNFADMTGFSSWGTGYEKKTTTFSDGAYVELASANKSTSNITDCPVTKGGDVIFKAPTGKKISSLTFTCTQWTTKAQTITLNKSSNGTSYTATSTTSSNFVLSASDLTDVTAVKFTFSSSSNQVGIKSIKVTYATGDDPTPEKTLESISVSGTPAELWTKDDFNHNGITVTATWNDQSTTDVTSSCDYSGYDMATAGNQTVTVTYKDKTCTYDIIVKTIANTQETAYSVADAIELVDAGKGLKQEVFIKGIISEIVTPWSEQYSNITYNISDDGKTTSQQFQLFRCNTNNGEVGDEVIAKGIMKKYNSIYEYDAANTIVYIKKSENPKTTATLTLSSKTSLAEGETDEFDVTYNGDGVLSVESSNTNAADVEISEGTVTVTAKAAGTTTITVSAPETDKYTAVSKSYTLTIVKKAEIPFFFNGGKSDIANTDGMQQDGLGNDYSSAPKLKFDDTDDYVIVNYTGVATILQYTIKGNSFNGSTFNVMESANGTVYTPIKTYTELDNLTNESYPLSIDTRYVKFVYTNKVGGNVALGNIKICNEIERATADGAYGTICLPFDAVAEGAIVMTMGGKADDGNLVFDYDAKGENNILEAGVPYLYRATADAQKFTAVEGGSVVTGAGTENGFVGTFTRIENIQGYFLYTVDNMFHPAGDYVNVGAYKCYIPNMDEVAPYAATLGRATVKFAVFDEDETGVNAIILESAIADGKYVENGNIIIVKNGVKYNLNGIKK